MTDTQETGRARKQSQRAPEDSVLSVERAFRMVELMSDAVEGYSLAELSREFAINKAIALRLLDTMEGLGLLWRDDVRQRYHLTFKISNLGLRQLQKGGLLDQCAATLKSLAGETGELVRLAVVEKDARITWVYAIAGVRRSVQIDPNYSLEIQLNTHAIAKAWLATIPFEQAYDLMKAQGIEARTRYSRTSVTALRTELAQTARRGYAVSYQEQELGVGAIAAPVLVRTLHGETRCVGAVSLAAPTSRMNQKELEACAPLLKTAVERLADGWPLEDGLPKPDLARGAQHFRN
jgi:IclR family acetate operon transcriptional repressor